jgi:hypothetical protein
VVVGPALVPQAVASSEMTARLVMARR